MKLKKLPLCLASCLSLMALQTVSAHSNKLTLDSVTKDVTYLASDELKGRASFSPEIEQAASYIAQRYSDIGLVPMTGQNPDKNASYKQSFNVHSITPNSFDLKLNNQKISGETLAMASTMSKISWKKSHVESGKVKHHVITAEDNMREMISALNKEGGQHFVLINTHHAKMFARYQAYFQRGLTKLNLSHQGAIVMVLTDEVSIDNLSVEATTTISKKSLTNVVGILPGKSKPSEMVLYSSHYDHLGDHGKDDDKIYNGADDDASGTSAVINIAQYYANKGENARTLVFAAFTAEEIGGFGSKYFSQQLDPKDITAMINIEMIGKPSKFGAGSVWMTGMERSNLGQLLNDNLKDQNIKIH